jgi:formylglycine-generating enzyme required for sulfatase activity
MKTQKKPQMMYGGRKALQAMVMGLLGAGLAHGQIRLEVVEGGAEKPAPGKPAAEGKKVVPVGEKPGLVVAPFDGSKAKEHQEAWSKHLQAPVQVENAIGLKLALIPAGEFMMGSPETEEGRQQKGEDLHKVRITKPFYLALYEVTQDEYSMMMGDNPSYRAARLARTKQNYDVDTSRFPVERASYIEALEFCKRLSELPEEKAAGRVYRLATEAEWEYAARAGSAEAFPFGAANNGVLANVNGNVPYGGDKPGPSLNRPSTVGSYPANNFGIFDTVGNKWEWVADWIGAYPKEEVSIDPRGPETGEARAVRGGSWRNPGVDCRSAMRFAYNPRIKAYDVSFRIAMDVPSVAVAAGQESAAAGKKEKAQEEKKDEGVVIEFNLGGLGGGVEPEKKVIPPTSKSPTTGMDFVRVDPLDLWVGKFETTNGEFRKMVEAHDSGSIDEGKISLNGDRQPVVNVNFVQARDFAIWMTEKDRAEGTLPKGYAYRLPFEFEWVAFAQCNTENEFPWGDTWPPTVGNFHGQESIGRSDKIEGFKDEFVGSCDVEKSGANRWGLFGVGGNVWEGCSWQNDYREAGAWRGGSWDTGSIGMCRIMFRSVGSPGYKFPNYGFRLVLAPIVEPKAEEDKKPETAKKPDAE